MVKEMPQLYFYGKLVGGFDEIMEMHSLGKLLTLFEQPRPAQIDIDLEEAKRKSPIKKVSLLRTVTAKKE